MEEEQTQVQDGQTERLLTDHQVQQWHDLLEARSAWLNLQGIGYVFLIVPDPHAIYADKLPEGVVPGATRPVLQVLDRLEKRESWAPVLYPLSALKDAREYGAYGAYRELMARLTEIVPVRGLARRELRLSHERRLDVIEPRARIVNDNRVRNDGRLVEYQALGQNALTCLVFGDSYAVRLVPLVSESFQRTFWAHAYFDYELIRELRPDVVVSVVSERSMIRVQTDTEPGIRRLEEQKRAAGDVMGPAR